MIPTRKPGTDPGFVRNRGLSPVFLKHRAARPLSARYGVNTPSSFPALDMDAGNLRNFDPTALRRPDAGATQGGAARLDVAAFTTQVLLELGSAVTDDAATPAKPSPGNEAPPVPRNGLLVHLSTRALEAAMPGRLPTDAMPAADYSHLRPGAAPAAHTLETLALQSMRPELVTPPLPGRPEQPAAPQIARPEPPLAPQIPRPEQLIAAQVLRPSSPLAPAPPQAPESATPRSPSSAPRASSARDLADLASPLRPQQQDSSTQRQAGVPVAGEAPLRPEAYVHTEVPVPFAAAAAAQAALAAAPPKTDAAPPIPRAVPEIMAPFFARSQTHSPMRLSIGRLVLAAVALAVVLLIVL